MKPLADLTTLRLGGPARTLTEARTDDEAIAAVTAADAAREPLLLLAGGSNVVIADEGFSGTVVRLATSGIESRDEGDTTLLEVQAGESWDALVERCVGGRLAGVECLSGIPGSTGATPIQNVGAYGQDVSETIVAVRVYDRETQAIEDLPPASCEFTYRSSAFKRNPGRWRSRSRSRSSARTTPSRSAIPSSPAPWGSRWARPRHSPTCARRCSRYAAGRGW
jgi:UDP-N-acetylmuramate dehydrogenase